VRVDLGGYGVGSGEEEEYGDRIGLDQECGFSTTWDVLRDSSTAY
jgi:hypothetical protein